MLFTAALVNLIILVSQMAVKTARWFVVIFAKKACSSFLCKVPARERSDFAMLEAGDPLFVEWDSLGVIPYTPTVSQPRVTWPFFINEAAYYEKGIALVLGERVELPAIRTTVSM